MPFTATTPYINTIPDTKQAPFPGSQEVERRIKSLVRWNALAMVMRANKKSEGVGGHRKKSSVAEHFPMVKPGRLSEAHGHRLRARKPAATAI